MPRRNEKFGAGGTNKVHYGRCASGALISDMDFSRLTPPGLQNHQVCLWDNNKRDTAIQKISKIYCELYIRREFEINTSLFINFQVFEYGCMYHIQYWPDFKDKLAVCSFWQYVDFITHRLVPKVSSVLSLTCFQFFTISDPAAALSSIMLFLSLDTVHMKGRTTGWSKIPGGPAGEWKATSWCRGTRITNVELPQAPAILLFNLRAVENLACPQPVFLFSDSLRAREHFLFFPPPPALSCACDQLIPREFYFHTRPWRSLKRKQRVCEQATKT